MVDLANFDFEFFRPLEIDRWTGRGISDVDDFGGSVVSCIGSDRDSRETLRFDLLDYSDCDCD